jgi:hypothetical protein
MNYLGALLGTHKTFYNNLTIKSTTVGTLAVRRGTRNSYRNDPLRVIVTNFVTTIPLI